MNWNERLYAALEDCDLIRGAKVRRTWESVAGGRIRVDLHFEVTTSSKLLAGEGVPYLIDRYRYMSANGGSIELRIHELPLNKNVVVLGEDHGK